MNYDRAMAETELEEDNDFSHASFAGGAGLGDGSMLLKALGSRAATVLGLAIGAFGELSSIDAGMRQGQIDAINAQLALSNAEKAGICP